MELGFDIFSMCSVWFFKLWYKVDGVYMDFSYSSKEGKERIKRECSYEYGYKFIL